MANNLPNQRPVNFSNTEPLGVRRPANTAPGRPKQFLRYRQILGLGELEREGDRVRLITRGGSNWTDRYPWIVEAARKIRQRRFVLDGEAVVLGVDGISDFNALHSRKHDDEVQFCAFDILVEGGDDLRQLPLSMRKTNLERLLARRPEGVFANPFERGEIGPDLFRAACNRPYQAGRSKHWVKIKNRQHPAMDRVKVFAA